MKNTLKVEICSKKRRKILAALGDCQLLKNKYFTLVSLVTVAILCKACKIFVPFNYPKITHS